MAGASEFEGAAFCSNVIIRDSFQAFQAAIASEVRRMQATIDDLHTQLVSQALSTQHSVPDEYQDVVNATIRELTADIDDGGRMRHQFEQSFQLVPDADLKENSVQPVQLKVAAVGDNVVPASGPSTEEPGDSDEPHVLDVSIQTEIHLEQEGYEDTLETSVTNKQRRTSVKETLGGEVVPNKRVTLAATLHRNVRDPNMLALDIIPSIIIFLNTLTIGLSLELYAGHVFWDFLELFFLLCYTLEAAVKARWFGLKFYLCGPERVWHWFDIFCIAVSIVDLCITFGGLSINSMSVGLTKMLRMARLIRLIRVLRFSLLDELRDMVYGILCGLRSLFWAVVLLMLCIYVFGVALMTILGTEEPAFGNLLASMFTAFRCFTDGCAAPDGTPLHHTLAERYGVFFMIPYILSFMLVTVGVFNLFMAVFIDQVAASRESRALEFIGESNFEMKTEITTMFYQHLMQHPEGLSNEQLVNLTSLESVIDLTDQLPPDMSISRDRFQELIKDERVLEVLKTADIKTGNMSDLFDVLDVDTSGELGVDELIHGLLSMRGPTTKADIIAIRLQVGYLTNLLEHWRRTSAMSGQISGFPQLD